MCFQKNGDFMNEKLVEFIENSDIDLEIKEFLKESLEIEDDIDVKYKNQYEKLVNKYVGDKL